MHKIMF